MRQLVSSASFLAAVLLLWRKRYGASQPHKHLQWVPRRLAPGLAELPVERSIEAALQRGSKTAELPFRHALVRRGASETAAAARAGYERLLADVGIAPITADSPCGAYNWLMTRRWAMAVPRTCEHWQGVSVNALGFAGALLARDGAEAAAIRAAGPAALLAAVTWAA